MNIPNKLTILRIFLIPIYLILMQFNISWIQYIAGIVFIFASLTDYLDGYIARKRNLVTNLGTFMDPLADKLLVLSSVIVFLGKGRIEAWAVVIIAARELIVMSVRIMAALKDRVLAADVFGKIKTITQLISVSAMHFENVFPSLITATNVIFYFSVAMSVFSGVNYTYKNFDVIRE